MLQVHVRNLVASGNLLPIWKELARAIVISTLDFFSFLHFYPSLLLLLLLFLLLLLLLLHFYQFPPAIPFPTIFSSPQIFPFLASTFPWKISPSYPPIILPIPLSLSPFLPHLSHLQDFVTKYSETNLQFSDSNVNFVRHQILEYAREILEKSKENKLTKEQFILLSENLEQAIVEVRKNQADFHLAGNIPLMWTPLGQTIMMYSFQGENSIHQHV